MIHFKPKIQSSWGKGFLTSVLGTTVSILLTFGTSALVENKEKADIQRQTAMMVIHDIDECIDQLEKMAKKEEEMNNAMQYVLAHIDQIASLPKDTLELAMDMLSDYEAEHAVFDDAKENIFKSSQDIWSNLDNMAFIDNMEKFYRQRREITNYIMKSPMFVRPINYEEYFETMMNAKNYAIDNVAVLKDKLQDRKVKFYIDFSVVRTRYYRLYTQDWKDISDRNKFIMNISDEELADYIKNSQRSGSSVKKSDLLGQWEREFNGNEHHYFEFLEKDSFTRKTLVTYTHPIFNDEAIVTYKFGGKWSLRDDTLFLVNSPRQIEIELDTSRITYRPEMRDSVKRFFRWLDIASWKTSFRKSLERQKRDTFPVTTNKAHDKLELVRPGKNGSVKSGYLKRVKDN